MPSPTNQTILNLHKKYAPYHQAFAIVYGHCQVIAEIIARIIEQRQLKVDAQLLHAAALLHDIGYYPLFDDTGYVSKPKLITHGVMGAEILRKEGFGEAICRMAERHTGVGLTKEHILETNLPLPARDLVAETPEEQLIMYADKLHTKAIQPDDPHEDLGWFNTPESYLQHTRKFGEANAVKFTQMIEEYGVPDLAGLAEKYGQKLK